MMRKQSLLEQIAPILLMIGLALLGLNLLVSSTESDLRPLAQATDTPPQPQPGPRPQCEDDPAPPPPVSASACPASTAGV